MRSEYQGRWLFNADGIVEGYLRLEQGRVAEVCRGRPPGGTSPSIVLPAFVNAHTHIGDSIAYPAPPGTLEELVAPPDGYKHRILKSVSRADKVMAMASSMELMSSTGTSTFIDFREEGVLGIDEINQAMSPSSPRAVVLGRPTTSEASDVELSKILERCDGIGMSAVRDWPIETMAKASRAARSAGKRFAVHASEAFREDIDVVLGLRPDFVVHMTMATDDDLRACAEAKVRVVVCPRSNAFMGIDLDLRRLIEAGLDVGLGTDNGMVSKPDMIDEMKAAYRSSLAKGGIEPLDAVRMATFGGRKVLNAHAKITPEIGVQDDLVVVRVKGRDPLLEMCTTSGSGDVETIIRGGRVWRSGPWR